MKCFWKRVHERAYTSELVRKVRSEGPQHVTVHGRDEVVVIAAEEFRRLQGNVTGEALIRAIRASPYRDINGITLHNYTHDPAAALSRAHDCSGRKPGRRPPRPSPDR
ncbi:MAG: type II toxin-antitoxin system prevent-host-death family antitoxin [Steroidobacteraceae bacterium]|nr:type II toxin-antitoxin system prevent-host-death family antitoxin [Steroidobacteraceae bacterium]MCW5573816.1 type II toxin-antitoxin system prevent-host-death family antitoxin [Steroidobacteraceae bacterium]